MDNKNILCKFWEKNKCKYMKTSYLCSYAHGKNDLIIQECKNSGNCFSLNKTYPMVDSNIITIIDKNNNIKTDVAIDGKRIQGVDKVLNYIDKYYIKLLKEKNKPINFLNKKLPFENNVVDSYTHSDTIHNDKSIYKFNDRIIELYEKWKKIYNIFKKYNFDYKNIKNNILELNEYTKDRNIYKVKERCVKIYNYYKKIIKKEVFEYKPISIIIKMSINN